jgi:hypothetical protein
MKMAYIENATGILETVRRYLPFNYTADYWEGTDVILITGEDVAGWTMEDYVIPRLNSGMYYPKRGC